MMGNDWLTDELMQRASKLIQEIDGIASQGTIYVVSRALYEAEKRGEERNKAFWQKWAHKRLDISRTQWLKAAKTALAGDIRDLRLRVELAEAPPVEIVASDDGN